jgi:hypothetical protein
MLNFIDKSFSTKKTLQYRLSIQVDLDGFSFCVYDCVQKKHAVLRHIPTDFSGSQELIPEKIEAIYSEIGWLSQPFASCSCIYLSQKNTLIPSSFYSKETLSTFLSFAYPLDEMDEVNYKISEEAKAVAIFAVPNTFASQLYTHHHNIRFFNQCIPLIEYALEQSSDRRLMTVNISSKTVDITLCSEGKLLFYNSFGVSSATDVLYYMVFAAKQLYIDPLFLPTLVSGNVSHELKQLLEANFSRLSLSGDVALPIASQHLTKYHLLLNLHKCE